MMAAMVAFRWPSMRVKRPNCRQIRGSIPAFMQPFWIEWRADRAQDQREKGEGDPVGVIVREEYVCDYCGKAITDANILIGKLALRKQGARGLGREVVLTLHPACSESLTKNAPSAARTRRRSSSAEATAEAPEPPAEAPKPRGRRRKAS